LSRQKAVARKGTALSLRVRLVKSGLTLIERSGAAALSLREVAKHAHVSHMAPYVCFRNKSELLSSIAAAGFGLLRKRLGSAAANCNGSPAEKFLASGLAYVQFSRRHPQLVSLMFGGLIPTERQSIELTSARGSAFSDLTAIVESAIGSGQFRRADPTAIAFAGWSIAHGFAQLALGGEVRYELGASQGQLLSYAENILRMLVDGLRQR